MAPSTHSLITNEVVCIFGTNPLDELAQARIYAAIARAMSLLEAGKEVKIAIFGCHQPRMTYTKYSEAQIMAQYLTDYLYHGLAVEEQDLAKKAYLLYLAKPENQYLYFAPEVNSTSKTCKRIVEDFLSHGDTVHLVMTWFSTPRLYYLMYRQAKRQKLFWKKTRERIYIVPSRCPNNFLSYVWREAKACVKAVLDPYSEKINLGRKH